MIPIDVKVLDRVPLIRYVLTFSIVHFCVALALGYVLTSLNAKPSSGMGVVIIMAAAYAATWRFTKTHKRLFTDREMWALIAGCAVYMLLFEAYGVWGNIERFDSLTIGTWVGIALFSIGLDVVFLWLAFRFGVRKIFVKNIEKDSDPTNERK